VTAPPARGGGKERCPAKIEPSFEIKLQTRVSSNRDWLAPWVDCLRHLPSRRACPSECRKDIIQSKGAKVLRDSPTFYLISVLHKKYILMCNVFRPSWYPLSYLIMPERLQKCGEQPTKTKYIGCRGCALRHPDPQVVISAHTLPIGSHLRARLSHVSSTQYIGSSNSHVCTRGTEI
jgi:hypothetical protein